MPPNLSLLPARPAMPTPSRSTSNEPSNLSREYGLHTPYSDGYTKGISIGVISFICLTLAVWLKSGGRDLMSGLMAMKIGLLHKCSGNWRVLGWATCRRTSNHRWGFSMGILKKKKWQSHAVALLQVSYLERTRAAFPNRSLMYSRVYLLKCVKL
jgi:hypothetical protein